MRDRRGGGRHANQGGEAGEPTSLLPTGERRRSSPSLPSAATRCLLSRRLPRAAAPFLSAALTISPPPSRHSHRPPSPPAWRAPPLPSLPPSSQRAPLILSHWPPHAAPSHWSPRTAAPLPPSRRPASAAAPFLYNNYQWIICPCCSLVFALSRSSLCRCHFGHLFGNNLHTPFILK